MPVIKNMSALGAVVVALAASAIVAPASAWAQATISINADGAHAGQLDVPVDKSQVLTVDRAFSKALIGNAEIADVLPLTNRSLYVLGKKTGTTSLTL